MDPQRQAMITWRLRGKPLEALPYEFSDRNKYLLILIYCMLLIVLGRTVYEAIVLLIWSRELIKSLLKKSAFGPKWPIRPELIPVSVAWSDWEYFYSPLDGMLVHRRVTPSIKFAGTHLYTWVERGTVRVKCLAQVHNTMSPNPERSLQSQAR